MISSINIKGYVEKIIIESNKLKLFVCIKFIIKLKFLAKRLRFFKGEGCRKWKEFWM